MQIQLMRSTAETKRVNKSAYIGSPYTMEGTLKDDCSVLDPVIEIQRSSSPVAVDYNYMYIPEFKRYYFIKIDVIYNNIWRITGHVDVLFTYMAQILNNQCIISKTQNVTQANTYINDGSFVMDSRKWNRVREFQGGFGDGENILICAGGAV